MFLILWLRKGEEHLTGERYYHTQENQRFPSPFPHAKAHLRELLGMTFCQRLEGLSSTLLTRIQDLYSRMSLTAAQGQCLPTHFHLFGVKESTMRR